MTPRTFLGVCPFRFTRFSPGLRWGPSQRLPSILQTSPLLTLPAGEAEKRISLTQSVANPGSNIPAQFPGTFPRKMESLGSPDCPEWGPRAGCLSRPQTLCGLLPEAPGSGKSSKAESSTTGWSMSWLLGFGDEQGSGSVLREPAAGRARRES